MAIILGKKTVGRYETLQYANEQYDWGDVVIGISHSYAFKAWLLARLTGRKCIYYCIDFYSPKIAKNFFDKIFIYLAMEIDRFLVHYVDEVWDISERINLGRLLYTGRMAESKIIPLSYPPEYFIFRKNESNKIAFVGLEPYGLELLHESYDFVWLGKDKLLPINELIEELSKCGIGLSLWEEDGNNYYGDPGKTKLYSACGLPVITTKNTAYAKIIEETQAGIVIGYTRTELSMAIDKIMSNYRFYKTNVLKTWEYINADSVFKNLRLLE